jgi:hemoglobin
MHDAPLFERLGGRPAIQAVVEKTLANHLANPVIKTRYEHAHMTQQEMVEGAVEFFCTGLTGVPTYTGRSMPEAHAGMNISVEEFCAVLDDIVDALDANGIVDPERSEVLGILYGMKSDIIRL